MRQNLDFEADKLNLLSVGKITIGLVNDAVTYGTIDSLECRWFLHLKFFLHAVHKLAFEDEKVSESRVFKEDVLHITH